MAMRGTLADLGVVDLLHLLAESHKTGQLIVAGPEEVANVYLAEGRLTHVEIGAKTGQQALVELVGWVEGEFEFRPEVLAASRSIDEDVQSAVARALTVRSARPGPRQPPSPAALASGLLQSLLEQYAASNPTVHCAAVTATGGAVMAFAGNGERYPDGIGPLCAEIAGFVSRFPRRPLQRLLLEDPSGTLAAVSLGAEELLLVSLTTDAHTGAALLAAKRLAAAITKQRARS